MLVNASELPLPPSTKNREASVDPVILLAVIFVSAVDLYTKDLKLPLFTPTEFYVTYSVIMHLRSSISSVMLPFFQHMN